MKIRDFLMITLPAALLVAVVWLMRVSGMERIIEWLDDRPGADD